MGVITGGIFFLSLSLLSFDFVFFLISLSLSCSRLSLCFTFLHTQHPASVTPTTTNQDQEIIPATMNDLLSDRHPSCVHSHNHHNTMSMVNQSAPYGSASCSCEECSRYKMPLQTEQSSATVTSLLQQQPNTAMMGGDCDRDSGATSSTSPPTTYLVRRASVANTASSPRMQPAGFGSASAQMAPHQRRASLEFHNRERSFQQHSTACDCKGSGVGCGCSFTCDC